MNILNVLLELFLLSQNMKIGELEKFLLIIVFGLKFINFNIKRDAKLNTLHPFFLFLINFIVINPSIS